jgi:hypothetical protein
MLALVSQNAWHHIQGDLLNIYLGGASYLTLICSSFLQVLYPNRIHGKRIYLKTVFCYMEIGVFHHHYKPNSYTVWSESHCALRLQYADFVVNISAHGHHFQHLL